jgi:segregation and condensation protein A
MSPLGELTVRWSGSDEEDFEIDEFEGAPPPDEAPDEATVESDAEPDAEPTDEQADEQGDST